MMIQIVIVAVAIWAPWVTPWNMKLRMATLEWLALEIGRTGIVSFSVAVPIAIILGALFGALAAWLRVWGAAYLGYDVVHHEQMQAGTVMAAGPYRYMRNPLYLGGWFMMAAISLLITPSGALFMLVLTAMFYLRLIFGEEAFLAGKLSEPYRQYLRAVPRFVPRFRAVIPAAEAHPRWMIAILTEIMPIGIFFTMAVVPWSYDNVAALNAILVCLVASLIVRGLMKAPIPTCVILSVGGASWGLVHLSIARALLIGGGAALVVWAIMPRRAAKPPHHAAPDPQ
jgi:protein-S-isoprenylcysteine O-methyltransferase Ste14